MDPGRCLDEKRSSIALTALARVGAIALFALLPGCYAHRQLTPDSLGKIGEALATSKPVNLVDIRGESTVFDGSRDQLILHVADSNGDTHEHVFRVVESIEISDSFVVMSGRNGNTEVEKRFQLDLVRKVGVRRYSAGRTAAVVTPLAVLGSVTFGLFVTAAVDISRSGYGFFGYGD